MTRPTRLAVPLAVAALLLAACGGGPDPAPGPAGSDPGPSEATPTAVDRVETPDRIPDDFPLTSGWKAGLKAPRRANADLPRCEDVDSGDPPNANAADRLLATWATRTRTRQLTLYPDAAAARAAARDLLGYYRGCGPATYGELPWHGTTSVRAVRDAPGPGTRWEVLQTVADRDGVFGGTVLQVVQVRRAVLLDVAGGLADGAAWTGRARSIAADQVTWSAGVISGMDGL